MSKANSGFNCTGKSTKELVVFAEKHADELRSIAGIHQGERFDPIVCLNRFDAVLIGPELLEALPLEVREAVDNLSVKEFSGGAQALPDGRLMIIANPKQTTERLRVTIMEEIAHRHLGHKPTLITSGPGGEGHRTYNSTLENEAYWTAAATLLPRFNIYQSIWRCESAAHIAMKYGVSIELVEFRIKILNLWKEYQKYSLINTEG